MGVGHVASGLAAGVATMGIVGDEPRAMATWVAVVTGTSLLPDLDFAGSRAGRMWGPVTRGIRVRFWRKRRTVVPGVATIIGTVAGGHRRGTHSVLGLVAVLVLVWLAQWSQIGTGVVLAVCVGLGLEAAGALVPGRQWVECWPLNLAVSVLVPVGLVQAGAQLPGWLPFAMAFGALVHILGDMITVQGCPLSWPTGTKRISLLPLRAGGKFERIILIPAFGVATFLLLADRAGFHPVSAIIDALEATA